MSEPQDQREEIIFEKALAFATAEARDAYLAGACGNDEALRQKIEALIRAHEKAADLKFLNMARREDEPPTLGRVASAIPELIQVGTETSTGEKYPKRVLDIAVGRPCKRLHFLHSAINASARNDGMQIGSYIIHYADGQQRVIPLVIGQDLADWWSQPNEQNKRFVIAWSGVNDLARQLGRTIRLFKTTWENPFPEVAVKSIDFVSSPDEPDPFLVAITLE